MQWRAGKLRVTNFKKQKLTGRKESIKVIDTKTVLFSKTLTVKKFVKDVSCIMLVNTSLNEAIAYACRLPETRRSIEEDLTFGKAN